MHNCVARLNVARLSTCLVGLAVFPVAVILCVPASSQDDYLAALLLLLVTGPLHELLHLVTARVLGIRVRLVFLKKYLLPGVKLVDSAPCTRCALIALAPQVLTAVFAVAYLATHYAPFLYVLTTHVAVSMADIAIACWLLRHRGAYVVDEGKHIALYQEVSRGR